MALCTDTDPKRLLQPFAASAPDRREERLRRLLQVGPPLLIWVAITAPAWAAVVAPRVFGFFLVLFAGYWLWRSTEFAMGALLGIWRLRSARGRDWRSEAERLPGAERVHHLVLIPTYRESESILADTLRHVAAQDYPLGRVAIVLAFEERDPMAPARARQLTQRFASLFGEWLVTFHPDVAGEVKGKSSNMAWAARRVQEQLVRSGRLPTGRLLVTVCDADSRLDPQYLAALTHAALSDPDGMAHIYQPALLFYANHWRLPMPVRAVNSVFSIYSLARLAGSHRLVPQSTYSLSWTAAERVGFWDVDVVPEDSHMFFKVWLKLRANVRARPIYLPVYADAAEGATLRRTLRNHYQQIRRWAWGCSDIPYVVLGALRASHLPWPTRLARAGWYVEEHLVWPSHWFILTLGGLVPPLLNPQYAHSAMGLWQAGAVSTLLGLCLPAIVVTVIGDAILRPKPLEGRGPIGLVVDLVGFAALPVTGLVLSALPALDANTRMLLGRSLSYQVTEKLPAAPNRNVGWSESRREIGGTHAGRTLESVRAYIRDAP